MSEKKTERLPVNFHLHSVGMEGRTIENPAHPGKTAHVATVSARYDLQEMPPHIAQHFGMRLSVEIDLRTVPNVQADELGKWVLATVDDHIRRLAVPLPDSATISKDRATSPADVPKG